MDELVRMVSEKTGIGEDKARVAVTTVINFLKDRLPAPIASQIDGVISGKGVGDVTKGIGGMFGSKE